MKSSKKTKYPMIIAIILVLYFFIQLGLFRIFSGLVNKTNKSANFNFSDNKGVSSFSGQIDPKSIEGVANKVSQSVVSIVSKSQKGTKYFSSGFGSASAGTGIIVSENGYILTNKHVVEGSSDISVVTNDGNSYDNVEIITTDPLSDIAILKISNAKGLKAAELGDSKALNIGQQVIAIGNALGEYDGTVTSGIISGIGRTVNASSDDGATKETLTDMIQTDAAINSGNSGGPLVNAQGQVVGVNTAVASEAQGIGFAIPISSVKGILKSIAEGKTPNRAYLGANYISVNPQVQKAYNLNVSKGALIKNRNGKSVISGSPAQKAGLKDGDIITKIDDIEISKNISLGSLIGEKSAGDKVKITYLRDGKESTSVATLEEYRK
jgi:peptidase Do